MSKSDEALVGQAQRGDRAAFEEIVRRTSRLLFACLYLETGGSHRAENLLQETWLRAYRSLGGLNSADRLRTWLLTIAQNVLADDVRGATRWKRAAPSRVRAEALANQPGRAPPPEEEAARAELRGRVLAVLRSLPEEYRLP